MKIFMMILFVITCINSFSQTKKTYQGPYSIGYTDGIATYTYFEKNDERILDGNFSFSTKGSSYSYTVSGKYANGKKTGSWITKDVSTKYDGMSVTKSDLKWYKVTEYTPFKEIIETTTENYSEDVLDGLTIVNKLYNNSWGSPAPGGKSTNSNNVKKNYKKGELVSIDGERKKGNVVTYSLKGNCINSYANGRWTVSIENISHNYDFVSGILFNYVQKDQSTGKIIEKEATMADTTNSYLFIKKNPNSYEVNYKESTNENRVAKIVIKKSNPKEIKLYFIKSFELEFPGISISECKDVFGEFPSPKQGRICIITIAKSDLSILEKIQFKSEKEKQDVLDIINSND